MVTYLKSLYCFVVQVPVVAEGNLPGHVFVVAVAFVSSLSDVDFLPVLWVELSECVVEEVAAGVAEVVVVATNVMLVVGAAGHDSFCIQLTRRRFSENFVLCRFAFSP